MKKKGKLQHKMTNAQYINVKGYSDFDNGVKIVWARKIPLI